MRLLARSPAGAAICAAQKPQGKPAQRPKPPAASTQRELLGQPPSTAAGLPQQPAGEQQAAQQVPASVSPAVTAAALAGSAAVAVDVSAPSSLHLLAPLDAAAHAWVSSGVWPDPALQHLLAGQLVSSGPIVAGLAGWAAVTAGALARPSPRLLRALGVAAAMYFLGGGSIRHGDPVLVGALKEAFERVRPSTAWHSTYSFPSGHTTATAFICGTLLYALLPAALAVLAEVQAARPAGEQQQQGGAGGAAGPVAAAAAALVQRRWLLCVAAAATTGVGRVLADDHWSSDVLAGAFLGAALTAATVQLCALVEAGVARGGRQA